MDYLKERSPSARIPPLSFSPKTQFAKVIEQLASTGLHRVWIVVTIYIYFLLFFFFVVQKEIDRPQVADLVGTNDNRMTNGEGQLGWYL